MNDNIKISRTGIEQYIRCPQCFFLQRKLGLKPPSMVPLTLAVAFGEFSDDGQEYGHVGCIYKVDKKGAYKETDIFLMYDADDSEWKFDSDVISKSGLI